MSERLLEQFAQVPCARATCHHAALPLASRKPSTHACRPASRPPAAEEQRFEQRFSFMEQLCRPDPVPFEHFAAVTDAKGVPPARVLATAQASWGGWWLGNTVAGRSRRLTTLPCASAACAAPALLPAASQLCTSTALHAGQLPASPRAGGRAAADAAAAGAASGRAGALGGVSGVLDGCMLADAFAGALAGATSELRMWGSLLPPGFDE